jgi:polyisoprenoid-binding protein YceI
MKTHTVLAAAAIALMATTLTAQSGSAVRLQLAPGSQLTFDGTSTMHGFSCTTKTMQAYIDVDPAYQTANLSTLAHPIVAVQVVIPVKSLSCGGEIESNMLKTLNATKYPYIIYKLSTYDMAGGSASAASFVAATQGRLTISGKDNDIAMSINATRGSDGMVAAAGAQTIKMTDFGVKPPTFFLGSLRVGNELKVKFTLKTTPAAVASAMAELSTRLAMAAASTSPATSPAEPQH